MTHLFKIRFSEFDVFVRRWDDENKEIDLEVREKDTGRLIGSTIEKAKLEKYKDGYSVGELAIHKDVFKKMKETLA